MVANPPSATPLDMGINAIRKRNLLWKFEIRVRNLITCASEYGALWKRELMHPRTALSVTAVADQAGALDVAYNLCPSLLRHTLLHAAEST